MDRNVYRKVYLNIQRKAATKIIAAYRTTSTKALEAVARTPPINLLARQRLDIEEEENRDETNVQLLDRWQEQWEKDDDTAAWTKALIKDIRSWKSRKHGDLNYHLTQILPGLPVPFQNEPHRHIPLL